MRNLRVKHRTTLTFYLINRERNVIIIKFCKSVEENLVNFYV